MPSDRRLLGSVVAIAAFGVLSGCATTAPGTPQPGAATTLGSGAPTSSASLPSRPADLKIDSVDPCTLLTADQQKQLGLDRAPRPSTAGNDSFGNRPCMYDRDYSKPYYGYMLTLVPQQGADAWRPGNYPLVEVSVWPSRVAGYGAMALVGGHTQNQICDIVVDVAQGENLSMQFNAVTAGVFTRDQVCQKAADAAAMAVQTLQSMR